VYALLDSVISLIWFYVHIHIVEFERVIDAVSILKPLKNIQRFKASNQSQVGARVFKTTTAAIYY
jgi:hypothetical protein